MQKFIYFDTMNHFIILSSIGKNDVSTIWSINNINMSRYQKKKKLTIFIQNRGFNPHVILEILAKNNFFKNCTYVYYKLNLTSWTQLKS